jgi:hypothetical protein
LYRNEKCSNLNIFSYQGHRSWWQGGHVLPFWQKFQKAEFLVSWKHKMFIQMIYLFKYHFIFSFACQFWELATFSHLFIYRTTKQKNNNTKYLYKMYIVINIKKRSDFLNSKRREYLATTNFFYILSFSYYFQLKHSLIWYACIS